MLSSDYEMITDAFSRAHMIKSKYIHNNVETIRIHKGTTEKIIQILERNLIQYAIDSSESSFDSLTMTYSYIYEERYNKSFIDEIFNVIWDGEQLDDNGHRISSNTISPYYDTFIFPESVADAVVDILNDKFSISPEINKLCDRYCCFEIEGARAKERDVPFTHKIFGCLNRNAIPLVVACDKDGKISYRNELNVADENGAFFYRMDLKYALKSTWEANIARLLKIKGINCEYEKTAFKQEDGCFFPDFTLADGTIIEVKGFWNERSLKHVSNFRKEYPQYNFYIIDQDMYYTICKKYSGQVPYWEGTDIQRNRPIEVKIVGITFGKRPSVVRQLFVGENVYLKRDGNNQYDKNAILVLTKTGDEIGFVSSDWASIYAQKLDVGMTFSCVIKDIGAKVITLSVVRDNPETDILYDFLR